MITKTLTLALLNPKAFTGFTVTLAQVTLNDQMGKVAGILNLIGLIIFFGGMLMSSVMYMLGRTEQMKYALVGSGIGGMAWVIVKTFFETSGQTMNVDLQPVN